jgi:hypothetical protein
MGTLAYPYESLAQTKRLIARLKRPTWPIRIVTETDDDEVVRIYHSSDVPDFVDDTLDEELGTHVQAHPRLKQFDGRPFIAKRLKAMLAVDEHHWRTKGVLASGSNSREQVESVEQLRRYFGLPPLPEPGVGKKPTPRATRASHSGIPHHNPRRARGLARRLAPPWVVRVMPDRYAKESGHYRAVLTDLQRYIVDKALLTTLNQRADRIRKPFDIRPAVRRYVKAMMREEGAAWRRTGCFVYEGAHFDAVNILRRATGLSQLT